MVQLHVQRIPMVLVRLKPVPMVAGERKQIVRIVHPVVIQRAVDPV